MSRLTPYVAARLAVACALILMIAPACAAQTATQFLQRSMARYQAMQSFQATCLWSMSHTTDTRSIAYVKPNRFKVVSNNPHIVMTSVSDGVHEVEYNNATGLGAMTYAAPASIAQATSMQMQHPMFCGSLLYKFFGGPSNLANLADTSKGAITFGPSVAVGGVPCRTVKFYGTGYYGHVQAAIGSRDGLVHRIVYDSAPLVAMVAQTMRSMPGSQKPTAQSLITTEIYKNVVLNQPIAEATFSAVVPKGMTTMNMSQAATTDQKPPVPLGQPAPDFAVKPLAGGAPVRLSSQRGHVVLLDFWATWCPPCRASLPETQSLFKRYVSSGLRVMTIDDETAPTISAFRAKNHYTFPTYLDRKEQASKAYKVSAIPTLVVIDAQGNLRGYFVGLQDGGTVQAALKKAGL